MALFCSLLVIGEENTRHGLSPLAYRLGQYAPVLFRLLSEFPIKEARNVPECRLQFPFAFVLTLLSISRVIVMNKFLYSKYSDNTAISDV